MMSLISLVRVVLVALLVLQQHCSVNALFGKLRKKEWLRFTSTGKDDSVDGIIGSAGGIRKMLVYQISGKAAKQEQMPGDISVTGDSAFDSINAPHMNAQVDTQIFEKNTVKEESKKFVDAEDEVAKLTSKDYSGRSGPRRKPPINNHKPTD